MPGLVRPLSLAGRLGFAVSIALLALAVSRWAPIEAQAPLDVRALPLAGPALGFAVLAALTGRDRRPGPWRRVALALLAAVTALALTVALRGPAGLPAEVVGPLGAGRCDRPRRHRRDRARPELTAGRAESQPAVGGGAARARLGPLRAVGGRPWPRGRVARRPRGARGRGRPAAGIDRDRPRRRADRAPRPPRPSRAWPPAASRLDAAGRAARDDPAAVPGAAAVPRGCGG